MKDFSKLDYLENGTSTQKEVFRILKYDKIIEKLNIYEPKLVGSIPLDINIDDSDVDIICFYSNKDSFIKDIELKFNMYSGFSIEISEDNAEETITISYCLSGFKFEIFAQNIQTDKQIAYRLLLIEHEILSKRGQDFKNKIIALKKLGLKTEAAFCKLLEISGNPYLEILKFEKNN